MRGGGFREVSQEAPVWPAQVWSSSSSISRASAQDRFPDVRCEKPWIAPGRIAWPCGQCPSCRKNRRRIWTHRIMLEAMHHVENGFVTLTYADEKIPADWSLRPEHLQLWLKRYRGRIAPRRVRYYAVGEYGDRTGRPHFHVALFGAGCRLGPNRIGKRGELICHCPTCCAVRDSWTFGHILVARLEERSAAYIAGYVLKKMTAMSDITCKVPPFARMSLNPGIGAAAVPDVASVMTRYKLLERLGDVPIGLRHGANVLPLGRYLRRRLRRKLGLSEECPDHVIEALRQGLLPVFEYADVVLAHPTVARFKKDLVRETFAELNRQDNLNVAAMSKIRKGSI